MARARTRERAQVVVAGQAVAVEPLTDALRLLPARIHGRGATDTRVPPGTVGIVLAAAGLGDGLSAACDAILARHDGVPLFVAVPDDFPDASVRDLYGRGVTAVFEWPRERRDLPRLLGSMLQLGVRGRSSAKDAALQRVLEARMKADGTPFGPGIILVVVDGTVVVSGSVDVLWKREILREVLAATPGVRDVLVRRLFVHGARTQDSDLARLARSVLRQAAGVDFSTLAVAVAQGRVTLSGTMRDAHELSQAIGLLERVRGVREICDRTVVARSLKLRDRAVARAAAAALAATFPGRCLDVSCYGSVAVLRGRVASAQDKLEAARLALRQTGISRVVNKIDVCR